MSAGHAPLRERVAAIVDPAVWANLGWRTRQGFDPVLDTKHSLAKADAILALPALAAAPALLEALKGASGAVEREAVAEARANRAPTGLRRTVAADRLARVHAALSLAEGEG